MERPEVNPHLHDQLFYDKGGKDMQGGAKVALQLLVYKTIINK